MTTPSPTVFVVDDYAPVRRSISRVLHAAGFAVAAFASAEEFLAQYDPRILGCLVLDLAMPTLDGLELQDILAKAGSVLPIIFLTGTADIPKSVQAMKHGASDFLTKPVNDEDLLSAVHRLGEEIARAVFHRLDALWNISGTGQKNDGQDTACFGENVLEFEAVEGRHSQIEHETAQYTRIILRQEFLCGRKSGHSKTSRM